MDAVRTCVGCRDRAPRTDLIRVVMQNGQLVIDERAALPGRGAWLHPSPECFDIAQRRRAFARALRVPPSSETVHAQTIQRHFHRNKG